MLIERLKTVGLFLPPLLAILYFGGWLLGALAYVVAILIGYEFLSFSTQLGRGAVLQRTIAVGLLPTGYLLYGWPGAAWGIIAAVTVIFVLEILRIEGERHDLQFDSSLASSFIGLCYAGGLGTALLAVALHPSGNIALFWLMMTVFLADTGAYFGGKHFGGPLFSPRISPKKTQSGALCGLMAGVLGSLLAGYIVGASSQWVSLALFGLVAGVFGEVGDLAESLLKRLYGVKDSGSILPGHGGLLDRIDGVLFAAPVLFFGPFS